MQEREREVVVGLRTRVLGEVDQRQHARAVARRAVVEDLRQPLGARPVADAQVERLRLVDVGAHKIGAAGAERQLGALQQAAGARADRVAQLRGATERGRGLQDGAALLRAQRHLLDRLRDDVVAPERGGGQVHGAAVGLVGEHARQRLVRGHPPLEPGRLVDRGPHERVAELDAGRGDGRQAGVDRRLEHRHGGRTAEQDPPGREDLGQAGGLVDGGDEQQRRGLLGHVAQTRGERLLEPGAERQRRVGAGRARRELDERERVPGSLRQQAGAQLRREVRRARVEQERRLAVAEAGQRVLLDAQLADLVVVAVAQREQHHHRVGVHAARDEGDRVARRTVEPVQVVGDRQHRLAVRRQQVERRQRDQERLRLAAFAEAERRLQGRSASGRQLADPAHDRAQQAVQAGVRDTGLRRDAGGAQHPHAALAGQRPRRLEQHRLADPGLAAERDRGAPLGQPAERGGQPPQLVVASDERRPLAVHGVRPPGHARSVSGRHESAA